MLLSVIMSTFNEDENFLKESIESILNQTYQKFEFLIIDDGSTNPAIGQILNSFSQIDDRIKIIHQNNEGLTINLNKLVYLSLGEVIVRQDSDDVSLNNRLEEIVNYFRQNKNAKVVLSKVKRINELGEELGVSPSFDFTSSRISNLLNYNNVLVHGSAALKKKFLIDIGGYNSSIKYSQDYELWRRIDLIDEIHFINKALYSLRFHSNSISSKKRQEQQYHFRSIKKQFNKKKGILLCSIINSSNLISSFVFNFYRIIYKYL